MTNTAPSLNRSRLEVLLPLAQGWLIGFAAAVLALAQRCNGRHRRLLKPFVLRLERCLLYWIFLCAFLRVALPPLQRGPRRPRFAPPGFRRVRTGGNVMRRFARLHARTASLTMRTRHSLDIALNPERAIRRLAARLNAMFARGGLTSARLVAIAPPALRLPTAISAPAPALADCPSSGELRQLSDFGSEALAHLV